MQATAPSASGWRRYDYASMSAESVDRAADDALAEADRLVQAVIATIGPRTWENTLGALSRAVEVVWRADGIGTSIGWIHPDEGVRVAAARMEERNNQWRRELGRRDDLTQVILEYAGTEDARALEGARRRSLEMWLRDIRRAGFELEPAAKAEFGRLRDRVGDLAVAFTRNLTEWSDELVLGPGDLDGLSESFVAQLPDGPEPGSRGLRIGYATVQPFLEQSSRRDLREEALRKYLSRARAANEPIIEEVIETRRRAAAIMGVDSWSEFANQARMSGGRAEVMAFLDGLIGPLRAVAASERAIMREMLAASGDTGDTGDTSELQVWDWQYVHDAQRRAIGIDSSELAEYFPADAVLAGLFDIVAEVFGVAVDRVPDAPVWHPDVLVYALTDVDSGEHLADLYLDLFARDGKRPGGWLEVLAPPDNSRGAARRPTVLSVVLNSAPPPHGEALLTHDDVVAVFHEFGHVLEFGLNRSEGSPANPGWIELDFVEAPSQIMEHWAWSPDVLRRFARHHETGAPPPDDLLEKLPATRRLNVGTTTLYFFLYRTLVDQYLHGPERMSAEQAYRRAFAVTGFPFMEGTFQPATFDHVLEFYDAGFYSYLWAQVFGDDMFSAFAEAGLLSADVGRRYRREILEPGWAVPGRQRVENFLGRPASDRAFLERLGIARG